MSDAPEKPPKQPYTPPTLVTYGDITVLTQATAINKRRPDGGTGKFQTRSL